ncbi:MAG: heme o synthase [Thermoanaerobaculia bacterium]
MESRALALSRPADWLELTKPRITLLVTLTTAAGFALASEGRFDFATFLAALAGTALVAAGSAVFNQVIERDLDRNMRRTANRPLPAGRLAIEPASLFGALLAVAGTLLLLLFANLLTAAIGVGTLVAYVAVYTPMKTRSSLATLVGAIPGAAPPVMGWTAATGEVGLGGWVLFAILFLWQLPHFLSIAWMYREDYRRAGMPLLTVNDPDGRSTARQTVLYAVALLPVSLMPSALGITGWIYLFGALFFGGLFLAAAWRFARQQSQATARRLLLSSVLYLPAVLSVAVADHLYLR